MRARNIFFCWHRLRAGKRGSKVHQVADCGILDRLVMLISRQSGTKIIKISRAAPHTAGRQVDSCYTVMHACKKNQFLSGLRKFWAWLHLQYAAKTLWPVQTMLVKHRPQPKNSRCKERQVLTLCANAKRSWPKTQKTHTWDWDHVGAKQSSPLVVLRKRNKGKMPATWLVL